MEQLQELRNLLLDLHKALLDYQKRIYEATVGTIASPGAYYDLVVNHQSFAWLKSLSALVISIDEILETKEPHNEPKVRGVFSYTKKLLTASNFGDTFETNYVTVIQKDSHIALLHGKIMQLLAN